MRVLWVTNGLIGEMAQKHHVPQVSGQWLNAQLELEVAAGNELVVVTTGTEADTLSAGKIKYIILPHGPLSLYAVTDQRRGDWERLLEQERVQLIIVWGMEYEMGKCALQAAQGKVPSAIYVQGVMKSIAENYRGGLTQKEIEGMTTLLERLRKVSFLDLEARQYRVQKLEEEYLTYTENLIIENVWAENVYRQLSPTIHFYHNRLPINAEFGVYPWRAENCEPHTIVTTAAMYPLKGLHVLLKALVIVKKIYPDIRLYVPGNNAVTVKGIKAQLRQSGYCRMLNRFIRKNGLMENIIFVGPLKPPEYAERMRRSEIFVTASAVENHCSSLREAMSVGVPCIASRVGGVPCYAEDHVNATLFPFPDETALADAILELLRDKALRQRYCENGKKTIRRMYVEDPLLTMQEIYTQILRTSA